MSCDEGQKVISVLTDWAIPAATNHLDVNFASPASKGSEDANALLARSRTPFNLAFNTELDFFAWLDLPKNKDRLNRFGHAMAATRQFETKEGILQGK